MEIAIVAAGKHMVSQVANSSLKKLEIVTIDPPEFSKSLMWWGEFWKILDLLLQRQ